MKDDPAISAIRKVRHEISASVDHDPRKLIAYLRKLQEMHQDRVILRKPDKRESADETAAVTQG